MSPSIPRFESDAVRPAVASCGFSKQSADVVVAIGMTKEQLTALLLRQDPAAKLEVVPATPADLKKIGKSWQLLSGRPMDPQNQARALRAGAWLVRGRGVRDLVKKSEDLYQLLRRVSLRSLFTDHDSP